MQRLPPSGVWFVNCISSVSDQVLRFLPVHILTQLWSPPDRWPVHSPVSQQVAMADAQQPDEHWSSNGQENGENGYSAYGSAYRENGYHGGAAAHPGAAGMNTACVSQSSERSCV